MKILRSFLVTFFVCFNVNAYGQGVDLNQALLGCIMSGGACLSHTGIPLVDRMFGGWETPRHTEESFCRAWLQNWCSGPAGYPGAHNQCREDKKQFWKKAKQKLGEWPSDQEFEKKYPSASWRPKSQEDTYFDKIEDDFRYTNGYRNSNPPYFTCTARQEYIWLKSRCSHTQVYKSGISDFRPGQGYFKSYSNDEWTKMKINTCSGD